ncbi:MAG: peptide chain release factor N(5)-glutamine methyltransferase [Candidatus Puniceispirillales bacterium]
MNKNKIDVYTLIKPEIEKLKKSGCETASLDCRLLLSKVIKKADPVYMHQDIFITDNEINKFRVLISERAEGKPVSRIINKRSFWKRDFKLNEEALDPRADSEILITTVLKYYPNLHEKLNILDLGSGSGCLGLSLLEEYKNSYVTFVDISEKSLQIARVNAKQFSLVDRSKYYNCDWNEKDWDRNLLEFIEKSKFDIVVSNPPYIPTNDIKLLKTEVKSFDPMIALDGGQDGLTAYKSIFLRLKNLLKDKGKVFVEIGEGQQSSVSKIGIENNFLEIGYEKDLSGIVRVIIFLAK